MKDLELLSVGAWAPFDHIFRMSRYPAEGETICLDMDITEAQTVHFGDCAANVAYAAARLGVHSGLASVVGGDFVSSGYLAHLQSANVNLEGLTVLENELSGHNYIFFDSNGNGFCLSHLGAAEQQEVIKVPKEVINRCKNIVINEKFCSYTLEAASIAKAGGACVYLNGMVDTAGLLAKDFLSLADVLFINQSEFIRLCKSIGGESALFNRYGLNLVFITMGTHGCLIRSPVGSKKIPIVKTSGVTDVTGAGDSFAAGVISALIRQHPPLYAAKAGATVSSFVIEKWGCQTNVPTWAEMEARMTGSFKE